MKSILPLLVMSCMTISLCGQWKIEYPAEELLHKGLRQKTISTDSTTGFYSRRNSKAIQDEMYSNSVRQNAITHQLDSVIYLGPSANSSQLIELFRSGFQYNAEDKLEVETHEYFNELLQTREFEDRIFYTYNENQQVALETRFTWDVENGTWINHSRREHEYDQMRLISMTIYSWNETIKDWQGSYKFAFTYNQSHQIETEIYADWNAIDLWVEMYRDEYDYTEGKLIELVSSQKFNPHDEWMYTYKKEFEYNSPGQLIYENNFAYQDTGNWRLYSRQGYTYDAKGYITEELSEYWNAEDNIWLPTSLDQYMYDLEGHETSYYWYNWNNTDQNWEGFYGGTTGYNQYGDRTESVDLQWNKILMDWEYREKTVFNYDLAVDFANVLWPYPESDPSDLYQRMPVSAQSYRYEGDWTLRDSTVLRYSIRTSAIMLAIETLTISPNPAHDFIQFSMPDIKENSTLNLYSADGKLITTSNIFENTKVSISALPPGFYIASIQNGNALFIGKFVKE